MEKDTTGHLFEFTGSTDHHLTTETLSENNNRYRS